MIDHIRGCGGDNAKLEVEQIESISMNKNDNSKISNNIVSKALDIYIMEKDSKKFYIYNTGD